MSKRISKTLYQNIPNRELVTLLLMSRDLNRLYEDQGIKMPALAHHVKGIDFEIDRRVRAKIEPLEEKTDGKTE